MISAPDFCGFYGIKPTRSLPYHPWSKGKVEKPFSYIETHFIQGSRFENFEEFLTKLKGFEDKMNGRIHSVTKKKPDVVFCFRWNRSFGYGKMRKRSWGKARVKIARRVRIKTNLIFNLFNIAG